MKNQSQSKWSYQAPARPKKRPLNRIWTRMKATLYIFKKAGSVRMKDRGVVRGSMLVVRDMVTSFPGRIILVIALCQLAYYLLSQ